MEGILRMLPDLNLTATGHDSGYIVASANMKAMHIEAAKAKGYLTEDQLYFDDDKALDGWQTLCPRGSPIRDVSHIADQLAKNERKQITLIEDHKEAINRCHNHPETQPLHRYTSWEGPRPALLPPLFAFATTTMHNDLLLPSLEQWEVSPGDDPTWTERTNDKVVWRETASNLNLSDKTNREMSQRPRLIRLDFDGNVTVQLSLSDTNDVTIGPLTAYTVPARELAADYFDFALVGDISSDCLPEDQALCDQCTASAPS